MVVKKTGGKVYGAVLTAAERKAMEIEINRQIAESEKEYRNNIDIMILYALHVNLGFGKKRLRQFYDAFTECHDSLVDHYEMSGKDNVWLADQKLKEIGVDVAAWNQEKSK